jgi:Na+/phosphate symporter
MTQHLKTIGSILKRLLYHTLYYATVSAFAVVALFLYGMEMLKAGLYRAKEYLKTELEHQD